MFKVIFRNGLQVIESMVELTGIEPVASSLRTRMPLLATNSHSIG
jgi:hypothetical protein